MTNGTTQEMADTSMASHPATAGSGSAESTVRALQSTSDASQNHALRGRLSYTISPARPLFLPCACPSDLPAPPSQLAPRPPASGWAAGGMSASRVHGGFDCARRTTVQRTFSSEKGGQVWACKDHHEGIRKDRAYRAACPCCQDEDTTPHFTNTCDGRGGEGRGLCSCRLSTPHNSTP